MKRERKREKERIITASKGSRGEREREKVQHIRGTIWNGIKWFW